MKIIDNNYKQNLGSKRKTQMAIKKPKEAQSMSPDSKEDSFENNLPSNKVKSKSSRAAVKFVNSKYPDVIKAAYHLAESTSPRLLLYSFSDFLIDESETVKGHFTSDDGLKELIDLHNYIASKPVKESDVCMYIGPDNKELDGKTFIAFDIKSGHVDCFERGSDPKDVYRFNVVDIFVKS